MSLFGAIHVAANAMRADQIAIQVVGQNIANASTPGYVREEVLLTTAPTQQLGRLVLGTGVQVSAVVQKIDRHLEERLRASVSDRASSEAQEQSYLRLETILNELSDVDLSTSLTEFFSQISEILNHPESVPARHLAVSKGVDLAAAINVLAERVQGLCLALNTQVEEIAERINRLTEEIASLNVKITETEGGDVSASDAVGLRDRRLAALEELAGLIDIKVREQESGGVAVYSGGSYIVFEGTRRPVQATWATDRGNNVNEVQLVETNAPLELTGGKLHGLMTSRDEILGGFLDGLDEFGAALAFEFNKVFSSGQGLNGFQELTSESWVEDSDVPLDEAGLDFTPVNGSFQVLVRNKTTGLEQTSDVFVDLNDLNGDTTLNDLAALLDAIDGISATALSTGELTITADSPEAEFFFADDTSGVLAALGLNVFFTGSSALDLGVSQALRDDPAKFAAARVESTPDPEGSNDWATANARILADLFDQPIVGPYRYSLSGIYDQLVAGAAQGSSSTRATAEGARVFEQTLRGEKLSISGVNIDEEAMDLIARQHSFQASARLIATVSELLEILVTL